MHPKLQFFSQTSSSSFLATLVLSSALALLTSCASKQATNNKALQEITYSKGLFENVPPATFIKHEDKGPFRSYVSMNLPYEGYASIRTSLEKKIPAKLLNRGEAHITLITPPEFDKILSRKVSIQEIDSLVERMKIQESPYKRICIGKASVKIQGQDESAYFVVVESDRLFAIRKAIQDLYVAKGGGAQDFNPEAYSPHVTLAYSKRDLHAEDGAVKDASSCIFTLRENSF